MLEDLHVTLVQEFHLQSCWLYDRYTCDHNSTMHLKHGRLSQLKAAVFKLYFFSQLGHL